MGEEFQNPLIVTGRVGFEEQNRSGFQSEERVVRDPGSNRPRLVRGNRYLERKGFSLSAEFYFVDGRTRADACTRRSSRKRSSTARSRRSRRSRRISS